MALQRVVVARRGATPPGRPSAPERPIIAINQISAEQLADAPTFSAIAGSLRTTLPTVRSWPTTPFDLEFLHAEWALAGQPPLRRGSTRW